VFAHIWKATTDATTVARKATLASTAPLLLRQWHDLQSRLLRRINRGEEATGFRRQAEFMR